MISTTFLLNILFLNLEISYSFKYIFTIIILGHITIRLVYIILYLSDH